METSKRRNLIIDMITIESIYIIKKFPRYHATTNTNARNIFTKELLLVALKYSYRFNIYRFRNRIINLQKIDIPYQRCSEVKYQKYIIQCKKHQNIKRSFYYRPAIEVDKYRKGQVKY